MYSRSFVFLFSPFLGSIMNWLLSKGLYLALYERKEKELIHFRIVKPLNYSMPPWEDKYLALTMTFTPEQVTSHRDLILSWKNLLCIHFLLSVVHFLFLRFQWRLREKNPEKRFSTKYICCPYSLFFLLFVVSRNSLICDLLLESFHSPSILRMMVDFTTFFYL